MKVAQKHIIAAIYAAEHVKGGKLLFFPRYAIKAYPYTGKDKRIGEFGWTISVVPNREK